MSNSYLEFVSDVAAHAIRQRAAARKGAEKPAEKPDPEAAQRAARNRHRDWLEQQRKAGMEMADVAFPNDHGNYCGKRLPKKHPKPLTAAERFRLLVGTFVIRRSRTYRFAA